MRTYLGIGGVVLNVEQGPIPVTFAPIVAIKIPVAIQRTVAQMGQQLPVEQY